MWLTAIAKFRKGGLSGAGRYDCAVSRFSFKASLGRV
jgi:hypothetical protein